ncbi:unnamed protein product [Phaedon cochleariae]|uniref:Uncharacterized protein n=1 Tax=Phaedon cochleariae TaxID=80249 RepID=A0A9P0DQD0_PHACE|nr:unnamed protein product [Phaedon cochleariae]
MNLLDLKTPVVIVFLFLMDIMMADDYLNESFQECVNTKDKYYCSKFQFLKFIKEFDYVWNNSSVNLVNIPRSGNNTSASSTARYNPGDSEINKFLKFLMRKFFEFMDTHGLAFILPSRFGKSLGTNPIADEERGNHTVPRGHKKKHQMYLIPILILAKILKVMILLGMVFSALFAVKKVLILGALILPVIVRNIKGACHKEEHVYHPVETPPVHSWWR